MRFELYHIAQPGLHAKPLEIYAAMTTTNASDTITPYVSPLMQLEKDWIDYNGHLNMAYYNVLFDRGCDGIFELLGMGPGYAATRKLTVYTAEAHVRYERELHLGDRVYSTVQLIDHDAKRLHLYQELVHKDGWLAASCEGMTLHVDMSGPSVTPFPNDVAEKIAAIAKTHSTLPRPEAIGRPIGIRR